MNSSNLIYISDSDDDNINNTNNNRINMESSDDETIYNPRLTIESVDEEDYLNLNEINTPELISFYSPLFRRPNIPNNSSLLISNNSSVERISRPILRRRNATRYERTTTPPLRIIRQNQNIGRIICEEEQCLICLDRLLDSTSLFSFNSCTHSIHERCYNEYKENKINIDGCFICKSK